MFVNSAEMYQISTKHVPHLQVVAVADLCAPPAVLEVVDGIGVEQQLVATMHVAMDAHESSGSVDAGRRAPVKGHHNRIRRNIPSAGCTRHIW